MGDSYKSLKTGWLISYDGFLGRVYIKKRDQIALLNERGDTKMMPSDAEFTVMKCETVYEVEGDLQSYAHKKAKEYNDIKVFHIKKDKSGTSKTQDADWADLFLFCSCGNTVFIELKTQTKLSDGQKVFRQWALDMGFDYEIATTPAEVDAIYNKYGDKL